MEENIICPQNPTHIFPRLFRISYIDINSWPYHFWFTLAAVIITTGPCNFSTLIHWLDLYKRMYWHPESFCQTSSWAQWYSASDLPIVPLDGLIVMITAVASQYKYVYKYRNPSCSDVLDLSVCPKHERWNFSVAFHHNFPGTVLLFSLANVVCDLSRMTVFTV